MGATEKLITAAGGNGTAIKIIESPLTRAEYEAQGNELLERIEAEHPEAEQAGFLVLDENHFEMAGGEFCGNATRSAAVLLSEASGEGNISFTVSGFKGTVEASVEQRSDSTYFVRCVFPGMPTDVEHVTLDDGQSAAIVDLGGIVHVVIEGVFPSDVEAYSAAHRAITEKFNLGEREAVGVIWFEKNQDAVLMHPVVWVKAVDTFYYESSCGSGTIAVGRVTGVPAIVQPTGKTISVEFTEDEVVLQSEMEIVR